MNNFDFSDYDDTPTTETKKATPQKVIKSDFDFEDYDQPPAPPEMGYNSINNLAEYGEYFGKLSPEERRKEMSKTNKLGFSKSALSAATLGGTEYIPGFETNEEEPGYTTGQIVGATLPLGLYFKAVGYPLKALQQFTNFGTKAKRALQVGQAATVGGLYETSKELVAGEELDPAKIALEGATFGGLDALFQGAGKGIKWLRGLRPKQQAKLLAEGVIPENLNKNQYTFFEKEVIPELQQAAGKMHQEAYDAAVFENNTSYQQEIKIAQAEHEQALHEAEQQFSKESLEYYVEQQKYQEKLNQLSAEHEFKLHELEQQNQQDISAFQQELKEYEQNAQKAELIQKSQERKAGAPLEGRVNAEGVDTGIRPAAPYEAEPTLKNRVGDLFSNQVIDNTYAAGQTLTKTVQDLDQAAYRKVNDAYKVSREANKQIESIHPVLVGRLQSMIAELDAIPSLSGPQEQLKKSLEKIVNDLVKMEEGVIIDYNPINNQVLLDQAQALRFKVDYDFAHGETNNIFKPAIRELQEAAEAAAEYVGDQGAIEANAAARKEYREWAKTFDSPYLRPIRDTSNKDFSKTFKGALDTDEYKVLSEALQQSPEGQAFDNVLKRELVNKRLAKYYKDPRLAKTEAFAEDMKELGAVITPEESGEIRNYFKEANVSKPLPRAKAETKARPTQPKIKQPKEIKKERLPLFEKAPPTRKAVKEAALPKPKKIIETPAMRAAAKLAEITPEQAVKLTDTVSGMKNLKETLSHTPGGKKIAEKIQQDKIKQILHEGNVERSFNGDELYRIINKGENYEMLSEILGEEVTNELLTKSKEIAGKRVTVDKLRKLGMKAGAMKTLFVLGVL